GFIGLRKFLRENQDVKLTKTVFPGMELRVEAPVTFRMNIHVLLTDELSDQELEDFKSKITLAMINRPLSDEAIASVPEKLSVDKIKHPDPRYDEHDDTPVRNLT